MCLTCSCLLNVLFLFINYSRKVSQFQKLKSCIRCPPDWTQPFLGFVVGNYGLFIDDTYDSWSKSIWGRGTDYKINERFTWIVQKDSVRFLFVIYIKESSVRRLNRKFEKHGSVVIPHVYQWSITFKSLSSRIILCTFSILIWVIAVSERLLAGTFPRQPKPRLKSVAQFFIHFRVNFCWPKIVLNDEFYEITIFQLDIRFLVTCDNITPFLCYADNNSPYPRT